MGNLFRALLAVTFVAATGICIFSLASRGSSDSRGDLAILVGSGMYGSFLTEEQKLQMEVVVKAYSRGDFVDLLITAPESLESTGHPPFAIAEYLEARGIVASHLKVDDEVRSPRELARKTKNLVAFGDYQRPLVFAAKFDLPLTKFILGRDGVKAAYVPTAPLQIRTIPGIAGQVVTMARIAGGFEAEPEPAAPHYTETLAMQEDLLFKPLDLMSSNETSIAWSRVSTVDRN